jgi:hypothetical protein
MPTLELPALLQRSGSRCPPRPLRLATAMRLLSLCPIA